MVILTTLILIFLSTFLLALLAVSAGWVVLRRGRVQQAHLPGVQPTREAPLLLRHQTLSTISAWHELLARFDFIEILKLRIAEAGLKWSVGRTTLMMLLMGAVFSAVLFAADWEPGVTAPLAAALGILTPYWIIMRKRKKRFHEIVEQFPEALDSIARALCAGHPFGAAVDLVASETPDPLAYELRRSCDEWQLGLAWNESLENLARRVPLLEIRLFAAAVVLQSRFGGKLNEILEELATTIRDSVALRGDVQAISAQGRLSGTVLTILPIAIAAIMFITSPAYIGVLIHHPDGKYLIAAAIASLVAGHLTIRRIVDVRL